MTAHDHLTVSIQATQQSLEERLRILLLGGRADAHAHTDAFVAAAGRHLAAVEQVLLPLVATHAADGPALVTRYREVARRLERSLVLLKGAAYGESHAIRLSWPALCQDVRRDLRAHDEAESGLVASLVAALSLAEDDEIAARLFHAEVAAPTRPHPHLPHTGAVGALARRLAALADRFWDTAQGRVVPAPVVPRQHTHDSLLAQYLTGDPHFDVRASVVSEKPRPGHRH